MMPLFAPLLVLAGLLLVFEGIHLRERRLKAQARSQRLHDALRRVEQNRHVWQNASGRYPTDDEAATAAFLAEMKEKL